MVFNGLQWSFLRIFPVREIACRKSSKDSFSCLHFGEILLEKPAKEQKNIQIPKIAFAGTPTLFKRQAPSGRSSSFSEAYNKL